MRSTRLALATACAATALTVAPAAAQFHDFKGWTGFDVGTPDQLQFAEEFERVDLDADGHLDLAVVSWGVAQHQLAVLVNRGDETYAPAAFYPLLNGGRDLACADFDGDGDVDIAVTEGGATSTGTSVAIFRNAGNATFGTAQHITVPTGPRGIAACDYDGDGDRDLAVTIYGPTGASTSIRLLVNQAGAFVNGATLAVAAGPACIAAADFDGDGREDLAVGHDKIDVIDILRAQGATFGAPQSFDVKATTESGSHLFSSIGIVDLDRDGDLDVAFSDNSHQKFMPLLRGVVTTLRNQGGGVFALGPDIVLRPGANGFTDMAFADLNGDGWPDVLGTDHQDWDFALSDGNGGFVQPGVVNYGFVATDEPTAIAAFDADGDGDQDALVLGSHSVALTVHRFANGVPEQGAAFSGPDGDLDAADIDGDGDLDLVGGGGGPIHVLKNNGNGTFAPEVTYPSGAFNGPEAVELHDLNGDALPDLVIGTLGGFNTRLNQGGAFGTLVQWNLPICGLDDLDLVDLDADGDLDVVLPESLGCPSVPQPRVYVIESNGNGTFVQPTGHEFTTDTLTIAVAHGDLDHDGNQDLVLAQNQWLEVRLGTGSLHAFGPKATFATGWAPHDIAVADLDGDGHLDLATCNWGGAGNDFANETMSVLLGNGDGTFAPVQIYAGASSWDLGSGSAIESGDVDRDGDVDLLVANFDSHDVSLFRNRGDGTFLPHVRVGGAFHLTDAVLGDFSGDGIADLMIAGEPAMLTPPSAILLRGLGSDPWVPAGAGLAGAGGPAYLDLDGALVPGATLSLQLVKAAPAAFGFHVVGTSALFAPVAGGVLVPAPTLLIPFVASGIGASQFASQPLGALPAGLELYAQSWFIDPSAPQGLAASNAVFATAP